MVQPKAVHRVLFLLLVASLGGVQARSVLAGPPEVVLPAAVLAASDGPETGEVPAAIEPQPADLNISPDQLKWHIPDPYHERPISQEELDRARQENDIATVTFLNRVAERIDSIRRPAQVHLTLEDVLLRTLGDSFVIEVQRYNPAVETTRVVEAEAAFDALFFSDITKNKVDRPTASQLYATDLDSLDMTFGVRKLMATGMQVSASYGMQRESTSFAYQQINPAYTSSIAFNFSQPLLRGFGIDVNRSMVHIYKNNRRISDLTFRRQVRDVIRQAEELYWALTQARRDVVITARLLADFERIYDYLVARKAYDVMEVQLAATKANLEQSRAEFVLKRAAVFDAEDRLIAIMNDPELNLADDVEIIPDDLPQLMRIVVDPIAEVQTALAQRPEIKERELQLANAKIVVGQARNAELPKLDLSFTYQIQGLAGSADRSFDEASRHNYVNYVTGVQFELPIGNRGPRAAYHRAELQHAQAKAALQVEIENTILDVNVAVRGLGTTYDLIGPSFESAEAREREVGSIVARAERKDVNTLTNELNARNSLAAARRAMLRAMIAYNIAIIDLEQAKGTLLRYNNVAIVTDED
ncbi:MAG: TolC family protein [Planctomycetes bacterium]|nr:TolC family protein [Planctomycetota bacterium]